MDHNPQGQGHGRRHFHRGRRGPDRRGPERRTPQQQGGHEPPARSDVDVEQIMRDIRARIAQRQGVELTDQQIQELAARRLESILDPRSVNPALLDQLRRATGAPPDAPVHRPEPPYTFEDTTLFESHRGLMRFFRKLLNPILKLFFNPNPLIRALNIQARLNTEALVREAERDRRQAEWNALHYELLQKVVLEISRVSLEGQALSAKVESLSAKVDFNERRVRGIEGVVHQARPAPRREYVDTPPAAPAAAAPEPGAPEMSGGGQPAVPAEGTKRRRRRRRGRRGGTVPGDQAAATAEAGGLAADSLEQADQADQDEGPEDEDVPMAAAGEESVFVAEALAAEEPASMTPEPEPVPAPAAAATPDLELPSSVVPPDGPERRDEEPPER